ncbi:MAG: hypothetical protein LRY76_02505 [Alphaproteobacteria bacterium]|nr:hypothetical protein [Alphaproteobacteria bacterium]
MSELLRWSVSSMPLKPRHFASDVLAALLYWPFARAAWLCEKLGLNVHNWPLSDYRYGTFRRMRNNSRDRFGTPLEQRFTQAEMRAMMEECGLTDIVFRDGTPYWCACGIKK